MEFACDQCQYTAATKGMLKVHHKFLHQYIKYSCEICGYQTAQRERLNQHQESTHEGEKFQCMEFNRQLDNQSGRKHSRFSHQNEKQFLQTELVCHARNAPSSSLSISCC